MIVSLPRRGIAAAALAAGLLLAGCSSDSDVPPTVASAPGGGTQINTDTGSGGVFPDVNTVPNERPTSTIQDLNQAPEGLSGAQSGTQYGEALVGGPSSSVAPPAPPPPPEPEQELAPIPEAGIQTEQSDVAPTEPPSTSAGAYVAPTEAPVASNEPIATPEVTEPRPMEPIAEAAPAPTVPQGQTIQGTTAQPADPEYEPQPAAPQQPADPVSAPQQESAPRQPQDELAVAPGGVQTPSLGAAQQAQLPASAYGSNYRAVAPEAYGITPPQSASPPYQPYAPAPTAYGAPVAPAPAPSFASYGQPQYSGPPIGLIYFRNGSSDLSSDDRSVLREIADLQRTYGGVVNVVGHASMRAGTAAHADYQRANQRISEARASAVGRQLMNYGVPQSAIRISAVGASQPLYSEAMPSGEVANRRAEVYLTAY